MPLTLTEEAEIFGRYIEEQAWANLEDDATFAVFRSSIYNDKSIDWGAMSAISCPKRKLAYLLWRYLGGPLRAAEMCQHLYGLKAEPPDKPWDASTAWTLTKAAINQLRAENSYPPRVGEEPVKPYQQAMIDEFLNNSLGKPYEGRISVERGADGNIAAFKLDPTPAKERSVAASEALGAPYGTTTGRMNSSQPSLQQFDYEALEIREWARQQHFSIDPWKKLEELKGVPTTWVPASSYHEDSLIRNYFNRPSTQFFPREALTKFKRKETDTMNKPFETRHYSYGTNVSKLSEQGLIAAIKNAEGELESLRTIKVKSTTIKGLKASLKTAIANLVQALDKTNNFTEGTTMNEAFKTVNYVYGTDITTMSTNSLIASIKKAEAERGALDAVQADSKKIATLKDEITAAIAKMVEALDART